MVLYRWMKKMDWQKCSLFALLLGIILSTGGTAFAQENQIIGYKIISETYNSVEIEVQYYYSGNKGSDIFIGVFIENFEDIQVDYLCGDGSSLSSIAQAAIGKQAVYSYQETCNLGESTDIRQSNQFEVRLYQLPGKETLLSKTFPYQKTWYRTKEIEEKEKLRADQQQQAFEENADDSINTSEAIFSDMLTVERDPFETKEEFLQRRKDLIGNFTGTIAFSDLPIALNVKKDELESPQEFQEFRSLLYQTLVTSLDSLIEQQNVIIRFVDIHNTLQLKRYVKQRKLQQSIMQLAYKLVGKFNESVTGHESDYQAGNAQLDKDGYDITTERFPVSFNWEGWAEQWTGLYHGYIIASRDEARAIWQEGESKPVYVTLKMIDDRLILDNVKLIAQGKEWNIPIFREDSTLLGHEGEVSSLTFSPHGELLASGSRDDKTIRLWDVTTGKILHTFTREWIPRNYYAHAFSPDGTILAVNPSLELYDVKTGEKLREMKKAGDVSSIGFSSDGHFVFGTEGFSAEKWDVETGERRDKLQWESGAIATTAPTSDEQLLAVGKGKISVYDMRSGQHLYKLNYARGMGNEITSLVFSPYARFLASSGDHGTTTQVWDMKTGQLLYNLEGRCSSFSSDGNLLATGSNNAILLWDMNTGTLTQRLLGHDKPILSVAFHPGGTLLASGGADFTIKLWTLSQVNSNSTSNVQNVESSKTLITAIGEVVIRGDNNIQLIEDIVEHDVNVNAIISEGDDASIGMTPLMLAARFGRADIVTILLEHGADVNIENTISDDNLGMTALLYAITSKGYIDVVRVLLEYEANIDVNPIVSGKHYAGMTPLMLAAQYGYVDIVTILLKYGADVNIENTISEDDLGMTALLYATLYGYADIVKNLLEHGANIDAKFNNFTALMIAETLHAENLLLVNMLRDVSSPMTEEQQAQVRHEQLRMAETDMRTLHTALNAYRSEHNKFPVEPAETVLNENILSTHYYGGKLTDAWGTPFQYWSDGENYQITSYGSDKKKGSNGDKYEKDIIIRNGEFR